MSAYSPKEVVAYSPKEVVALQLHAYAKLFRLVTAFDEDVAAQIKEREKFPEYVDATEILIEKARPTAEALHEIMMEVGHVIPSPIYEILNDVYRELYTTTAYAESGRCGPRESADRCAHDGVDNLRTALRKLQDHLDIKKAALG